jgi:hypothetical protein
MSPNNQNPVFTDNETITGDGTVENPLAAAGSGGITEITSDDGSVTITDPTGPTVDLSVVAGAIGGVTTESAAGPIPITGSGSMQEVISSGPIDLPASGSWGVLMFVSFVMVPAIGLTQILWKFQRDSDSAQLGQSGGEIPLANGSDFYSRNWMAVSLGAWTDGDSVDFFMSAAGAGVEISQATIAVFLVPASL